jgi:hypothetical protein
MEKLKKHLLLTILHMESSQLSSYRKN